MGYECPTCQRTFDSRRGLGVHHALVHGERIKNRTCQNCGMAFYAEFEKKYCSERCRRERVSFQGEAKPNFSDAMESTGCEICGKTFEYYPSEKVGRYCPDCVEDESWQTPPIFHGSEHPRWSGGKMQRECVVCGDSVERYPSGFVSEIALCCEDCRRAWLSETFSGDGQPNWKGGGNEAYGTGWNALRRAALERDEYQCVACGKSAWEIGRNPDVHHIVPVRWFIESADHEKEDAHRLDNVVSLCVQCHRKADFGKIARRSLKSLID